MKLNSALIKLFLVLGFETKRVTEEKIWSQNCVKDVFGTSLVVQWLRIRLPMQGTRVRSLVGDSSTCCGATDSVYQDY